jgi:plasmid maintenance system antidote protein VapI
MATAIPGLRRLREYFGRQPHLTKAHEAEAMSMSPQQLGHILAGRRNPTLAQAIEIYRQTGIEPHLWNRKKGKPDDRKRKRKKRSSQS